jgi:hypothetical protein
METLQNRKVKPTKLTAPVHCSQNSKVPPPPSSSTSSASSAFLTLLETRIKNSQEQTAGHFSELRKECRKQRKQSTETKSDTAERIRTIEATREIKARATYMQRKTGENKLRDRSSLKKPTTRRRLGTRRPPNPTNANPRAPNPRHLHSHGRTS